MMYKDKDKQREANAERQRRYKAKQKALLNEGVTDKALPDIRLLEPMSVGQPKPEHINPKRGKDIKCFEDLHPGIQQTIDRMSMVDGKIDKDDKAKRTAAAVKYQHIFSSILREVVLDRFYSTGVA